MKRNIPFFLYLIFNSLLTLDSIRFDSILQKKGFSIVHENREREKKMQIISWTIFYEFDYKTIFRLANIHNDRMKKKFLSHSRYCWFLYVSMRKGSFSVSPEYPSLHINFEFWKKKLLFWVVVSCGNINVNRGEKNKMKIDNKNRGT